MFEHKIELLHCQAIEGVLRKNELIESGLYLNVDFTWSYHGPQYDNFGHEPVIPRRVEFTFKDQALATFYRLKWAS